MRNKHNMRNNKNTKKKEYIPKHTHKNRKTCMGQETQDVGQWISYEKKKTNYILHLSVTKKRLEISIK